MRATTCVVMALTAAAMLPGCGSVDDGVTNARTGILFINDSRRDVDILVEGCDEFHLPARQEGVSSRYTAHCESTEDVVWTIHAHGEWVLRPGTPPIMGKHEHSATARSGDTVRVITSHNIYYLEVSSEGW